MPLLRLAQRDDGSALGIVQEGDPILREVARPFDLPAEAEDARPCHRSAGVGDGARRESVHTFGKGMGMRPRRSVSAAAAALVRTPDGERSRWSTRVIEETPGDEQYEGCLSFFDVRGMVPPPARSPRRAPGPRRPPDASPSSSGPPARLVAHELDHLGGVLYTDRMAAELSTIPVSRVPARRPRLALLRLSPPPSRAESGP